MISVLSLWNNCSDKKVARASACRVAAPGDACLDRYWHTSLKRLRITKRTVQPNPFVFGTQSRYSIYDLVVLISKLVPESTRSLRIMFSEVNLNEAAGAAAGGPLYVFGR